MYKTKIDLNQRWPIREAWQFGTLVEKLNKLGGEIRFDETYQNQPAYQDSLAKQEELHGMGLDPSADLVDLSRVPINLKYAQMFLQVYHSRDNDITTVFEHQTGALSFIQSDRSSLSISGPDKITVDNYIVRLFESLPQLKRN